ASRRRETAGPESGAQWIWTRAPPSLYSSAKEPPRIPNAAVTLAAGAESIGLIGLGTGVICVREGAPGEEALVVPLAGSESALGSSSMVDSTCAASVRPGCNCR